MLRRLQKGLKSLWNARNATEIVGTQGLGGLYYGEASAFLSSRRRERRIAMIDKGLRKGENRHGGPRRALYIDSRF